MVNHPNRSKKPLAQMTDARGREYQVIRWDGGFLVRRYHSDDSWSMGNCHRTLPAAEKEMREWAQEAAQ